MNRSVRFWTWMAVFQVAFGLAVFGLTRQYYLPSGPERAGPAATAAGQPHPMPTLPAASADDDLARLIATFPGPGGTRDPAVLARQGDESFNRGEYQHAAERYAQALSAGDQDVNTYNSLGLTLHYLGRSGEALEVLGEGVALDAGYQRIWLTLGFVHGQVGHSGQARDALEKAWEMGPENDIGRAAADMLEQLQ